MTEKNSTANEAKPVEETTKANEQDSEGEAGASASPSVNSPDDAHTEEPNPAASYDETDRKQDKAINELAEQTKWIKLQTVFSIILGALTLGVLVYHGIVMRNQSKAMTEQTAVMRGQLESMNSSSQQTQDLINATRETANASQSVAEQNKELVRHAGEQAAASQAQANVSIVQAETGKQAAIAAQTSARATELGADIAQKSFYIGERPYVAVSDMNLLNFTPGQTPSVEVMYENTGRTPALEFLHQALIVSVPQPLADIAGYGPVVTRPSKGFIAAGQSKRQVITNPSAIPIGGNDVELIKSGKLLLYVYGMATYKDGIGKPHMLQFCGLYLPGRNVFQACPFYNSTN
jgi:hypothetical protein